MNGIWKNEKLNQLIKKRMLTTQRDQFFHLYQSYKLKRE